MWEAFWTVHPQLHGLMGVKEFIRPLWGLGCLGAGACLAAALSELQQHRQGAREAVTLHPTQREFS